ncbi:acyl-CoA carboxylase subunit epsilon [Amycolatopsis sp. NPDC059027]|uniref:acyl-CoA carboxylase subunit epsilon n=1 Tax=Amycolatopsis sp. NPDC059027 TaxID=3346709 RepID=UPI003670CA44
MFWESTVDYSVLRVVRGVPDEVELAALISVLAGLATTSAACVARGARGARGAGEGRRVWAHPVWRPGTSPRAARGAWRASLLPR